jgi:hypothetical protein
MYLNPADFIKSHEAQAAVMVPQLYFHYMSGIMEESVAEAAQTKSAREEARERASLHFETWKRGLEIRDRDESRPDSRYINMDVFHLRALAIAKTRGGRGFPPDAVESAKLWEKLESLGVVEAKNRLGLLHFNRDLGGASRPELAARKFREAAALGDRNAPYNLAELYALGDEGAPDFKRAKETLEMAASRGNDHPLLREVLSGEKPATSWSAENEAGDRMEATLYLPSKYPARLKTYARGKERPGRVLAFKVRYTVASVGSVRIFPPSNRFNFYSPSPVLMDEGEHIVWVAMSAPAKLIEYIDLNMVHGTDDKPVLTLRVPVLARWENEEEAP